MGLMAVADTVKQRSHPTGWKTVHRLNFLSIGGWYSRSRVNSETGRRAGSNRRVELWQATLSQFFKAVGAVGCGTPSGYESISHSAYPPSANQMVARARTRSPRLGTLGLRAADLAAAALGGRPRPRLAGCSIA